MSPSVEHSEYAQQLSSLTAVLRCLHDDHVHVLRTEIKLSYIQFHPTMNSYLLVKFFMFLKYKPKKLGFSFLKLFGEFSAGDQT